MKRLKESIGRNLCDLGLGKDILDSTPKAWFIKEQIDKLDFFKIKNFTNHLRKWKEKSQIRRKYL